MWLKNAQPKTQKLDAANAARTNVCPDRAGIGRMPRAGDGREVWAAFLHAPRTNENVRVVCAEKVLPLMLK